MTKKSLLFTIIAVLTGLLFPATDGMGLDIPESGKDYSRLVPLIKLEDKLEPTYPFNDFVEEIDKESHESIMEYFNTQSEIMKKIQKDLGGGKIRYRVKHFMNRTLYVPETRNEYTKLFENYCHDVINFVLTKTGNQNPFKNILTLTDKKPALSRIGPGIKAFLVHNLATEYKATYVFFNERGKQVSITLNGSIFTGNVGSYSTNIYLQNDGAFAFERDRFTLWQNSAGNPYRALTVPVEETFHITLRTFTERAIRKKLERNSVKSVKEAEAIVQDWMAVEEAIVGGLVYNLMPIFIDKHLKKLPRIMIKRDIESRSHFEEYLHLKRGIKIVEKLGYKKTMAMYRKSPMAFKRLLVSR